MVLKIPIEDAIPGMSIVLPPDQYKRRNVVVVTSVHVENHKFYDNRSARIGMDIAAEPGVKINGNSEVWRLGTVVDVVPKKPVVEVTWSITREAWDVKIASEGDVYITLNDHEVGDGVIHAVAERVKELS